MACAYCGKEVPFRMRLTGEDHFCSVEHKRLYRDEHSRIGLARLLEEVSTEPEKKAVVEAENIATAEVGLDEQSAIDALPEPELVYSGQGLRLWTFAYQPHSFKPRFDHLAAEGLAPVEYSCGKGSPPGLEKTGDESADASDQGSLAQGPSGDEVRDGKKTRTTGQSEDRAADNPPSDDKKFAVSGQPAGSRAVKEPSFQTVERRTGGGYKVVAGVALALCLGVGGYFGLGVGSRRNGTAPVARSEPSMLDEWIPNWSQAAEAAGEIALFGPSEEWSDYRVQWKTGREKNLAWVFRAADPRNYYAVQIHPVDSDDLRLIRYAVVRGARSDLVESTLAAPASGGEDWAVELEVNGSRFVLYLEGKSIAEWSDDRLPRGGFGVVRPDMGLAAVDDVKVIRLDGRSARNRHFWTGLPPDTMPEVTALPPMHESSPESEEL